MTRSAVYSPCGQYRYVLRAIWDHGKPPVAFVGLNPSTATEEQDDPTVRRCIRYARDWGHGGLVMLNLLAYRSTDPEGLLYAHDPVGEANWAFLEYETAFVARTIAAWGAFVDRLDPRHLRPGLDALEGRQLDALGFTQAGRPRHPLYMRADVLPVPMRTAIVHRLPVGRFPAVPFEQKIAG